MKLLVGNVRSWFAICLAKVSYSSSDSAATLAISCSLFIADSKAVSFLILLPFLIPVTE